jgi:hypothetical protein
MAPSGGAAPAPGQRNAGENAGESPNQKPATPSMDGQAGTRQNAPDAGRANDQTQPGQQGAQPESGKPGTDQAGGKPKGAARPAPKITDVQRTKIRQSVRNIDVRPVHVNFKIGVGIAVPRTVVLQPVPTTIIDVVPEYEGFRYFVVPGRLVIVDPDTLDIVAVLPL